MAQSEKIRRVLAWLAGLPSRRLLVLVLCAGLTCSGAAWLTAEFYAERLEQGAKAAALARAEVAAGAIEQSLLRTLEAVESLHDLAQARHRLSESHDQGGRAAIERQLEATTRRSRFGVLQVAVIGADGHLAWSSSPGWTRLDLSDREHFRVHREGLQSLFISVPLMGRISGQWSLQMTRPLQDAAGHFAGVAVVSIDPVELSLHLAKLQIGPGSTAYVLRRDGTVLASSQDAEQALGKILPPGAPLMQAIHTSTAGRIWVPKGISVSGPRLVGYQVLAGPPLAAAVSVDPKQALEAAAYARPALRMAAAALSFLVMALAGMALLWLARQRTQRALEVARRERVSALEQLAQAQRMEALGRLAGGVAHDFNNVLQAVLGGTRALQRRAADPVAVQRLAGIVLEAAERGASVTRRLLAFARRGELRAEPVETTSLLQGMAEVLAHTLGASIQVRIEAEPDLPPVLADRGQLETVLVNLAVNGRDAMESTGGGTLTLSAAPEERAPLSSEGTALPPGQYLRITVRDTGMGMDAAVLAHAAEPFFTTKPKGKGTGLGLAMAKGFAEQSGGAFRIESTQGAGTTVTLWLPRAPAGPCPPVKSARQLPVPPAPAKGRILVVDDEPQVRATLALGLQDCGYAVEEAGGGAAALARLQAGGFDLIVTDLAMPGMNGLELLREARKQHPGIPALLVTGYAGDAEGANFAAAAGEGPLLLLRKPVDLDEFANRVSALLHLTSAEAG